MLEQGLESENRGCSGRFIEAAVLVLMGLSAVFIFSASANVRSDYDWTHFWRYTSLKQLIFFPLAVLVMYLISLIDYRRLSFSRKDRQALQGGGLWRSFTPYLLILSFILLVVVLIPGIGQGIGENRDFARRWLNIPLGPVSLRFQPSEFAKWVLVIFIAAVCDMWADGVRRFWKGFLPISAVCAAMICLIIKEDFGTAAFIGGLSCMMLLIGGVKIWHLAGPVLAMVPVLYFAIVNSETRLNRIRTFLNPELDPEKFHQAKQSLIAISSGGLFGKGLGRGVLKYGYVPEDTTDFIFAIICEELGFAGAVTVICMFVAIAVFGLMVALRCRDRFGRMLAGGIVLTIVIQAAVNMGVVTVVLPTKGIGLPFVSAGGTSLLLSAAAMGVLLNIAKSEQQSKPKTLIENPGIDDE